jgi:N-methylhydantoinase A
LPGQQITGPAIIEQLDSTTVIFPGQKARIDAFDNILISLHEEV